MQKSLSVLGAGIVGISCALELQRRGYQVTLLDRRGFGEETSSGNAGILSYSNVTPLANPNLLATAHRMILNRDPRFQIHYPHLLQLLPWLTRFLLRCRRSTYLADGAAMASITLPSIELHKRWIAQAEAGELLNLGGVLKVYRHQQSYAKDELERELLQSCGINYTPVDADQLHELEPGLRRIFARGTLIDDSISIRNPEKLCKAYADLFIQAGGQFRRTEIRALQPLERKWKLLTADGSESADALVLCLGAWTPELLGPLGYPNRMAIERGYHRIYAAASENRLHHPIFDIDGGYVMTSMDMGLRVSTGINLVQHEARATPRQLDLVAPRLSEAFAHGDPLSEKAWMGRRPTMPDTLPMIGPAPRHRNLWLAFAHSHMGLTMGPMTAQLIANFIDGAPQPIAIDPLAPARYF